MTTTNKEYANGNEGTCDKEGIPEVKRIRLCKVHDEVHCTNGFSEGGCINSDCDDLCCTGSAEFDKHAYELVIKHWDKIKPLIGKDIAPEDCFEGEWLNDPEYIGGNAIDSKIDPKTGYCMFHLPTGKGCSLFRLVFSEGLPKGMIPSICKLFPVTWRDSTLMVSDKSDIPHTCECMSSKKNSKKRSSLFETQRHAIEEIFEMHE